MQLAKRGRLDGVVDDVVGLDEVLFSKLFNELMKAERESSRREPFSSRPLTPPYVRDRIRRFMITMTQLIVLLSYASQQQYSF